MMAHYIHRHRLLARNFYVLQHTHITQLTCINTLCQCTVQRDACMDYGM